MGAMSVMYGNILMSLSSLVFPLLNQRYTDKQIKEYEERRLEKYNIYLSQKRQEIANEINEEGRIFSENYPSLDTVLHYAIDGKKLWERRRTDDDFLNVRIGVGTVPLKAEISYSQRGFQLDTDELQEQMYRIAEKKYTLEYFPIFVDLLNNPVCGIVTESGSADDNENRNRAEFVKRMILRIVSLYSYDEVKIIFISDEDTLSNLDFIKFLPHIWDNQKSTRFLATNDSEAYQIGEYLKKQFEDDLNKDRTYDEKHSSRPHYILFGLDGQLVNSIEIIKQIMQTDKKLGFTAVCAYDDIPKECSLLITLGKNRTYIKYLKDLDKKNQLFIPDRYDEMLANKSMQTLGNTMLGVGSKAYILPKSYKFLSMFNAGKVEDLNIFSRWKDSDPVSTLAAPVGLDENGDLFMLDLHQKYEGPHGLVAGMTGSGKSEFLITYILSMAICYSPEDVAFVLIDYKGGGLTGAFEDKDRGIHLPHLLGTITNLDGSAINRALASFHSELMRRQRIFNEAKSIAEEGTMDIYMYQRLYRSGKVKSLGPVPHLFIISDEFAELKSQQPDFLDELVSIARIGRSLGVHLILATQKPTGVVNDQIRSNTKFRVCLKVQDRMDSEDMINRPDAAELKETGRFYLQVGYDEFFAMGQSAWSGADYTPSDFVDEQSSDEEIELIDNAGEVVQTVRPDKNKNAQGTQLTAVVNYLSDAAKQLDSMPDPLWSEPLPKVLELSSLIQEKTDGSIIADIGMVDDPENQKQFVYSLDLIKSGNTLVVGNAGTGKTIFLQSLLISLCTKYSSEDFNFYALDYSSRMLKLFKDVPQCGAVLTDEEYQYVPAVFQKLSEIIDDRKKIFESLGVNDFESANRVQKFPLILIVIDNVMGMQLDKSASRFYSILDHFMKLGLNYGVRFIITSPHINELPMKLKQEIVYRIAFRVNTNYEYGDIINVRVRYMPTDCLGRALINVDNKALEMQVGLFASDSKNESLRTKAIKDYLGKIIASNTSKPASKLAVLSSDETYEEFSEMFKPGRLAIGYRLKNSEPVSIPLVQLNRLNLYFGNSKIFMPVIHNLFYAFMKNEASVHIIKKKDESIFVQGSLPFEENSIKYDIFECTIKDIVNVFINIKNEIQEKQNLRHEYCDANNFDIYKWAALMEAGGDAYLKELKKHDSELIAKSMKPTFLFIEELGDFISTTNEANNLINKAVQDAKANENADASENMNNVEESEDVTLAKTFMQMVKGFLPYMQYYQIYLVSCSDSENSYMLSGDVFERIIQDSIAILMGGNYPSQKIAKNYYGENNKDKDKFNTAIIQYRRMTYKIQLLIQEEKDLKQDTDFMPIFEDYD